MIKKSINKILNKFGYIISKYYPKEYSQDFGYELGHDFEKEAAPLIKIVRKNSMLPLINLLTLFEQVRFCELNDIEGDYVECGVWKGGAIGLMALTNLMYGKKRRNLHLFDIFDAIGAPDKEIDGEKAINEVKEILGKDAKISGELEPLNGIYDHFGGPSTLEDNQNLLEKVINYPKDFISYYKGWFQNTIPENREIIKKIAILRLDGDWYASVKIPLENLFDKVVRGGFIIIDDYGYYDGCTKAVNEFIEKRNIKTFLNYSNSTCRYFIKNCD